MAKRLGIAPRYFGELWLFLKDRNVHVAYIRTPEKDEPYAPWAAFVTGVAIFLSILALDAARSVRHFDRVVLFSMLIFSTAIFIVTLHLAAKILRGRASFGQAICGGEYLIGFLLPSVTLVNYCVVSLLNYIPGIKSSLGYFNLYYSIVPTTLNRVLITLALGVMILGASYSAYRTFIMFRDLEQLNSWKTGVAIVCAIIPLIFLHSWLEFWARLLSGHLQNVAKVLTFS